MADSSHNDVVDDDVVDDVFEDTGLVAAPTAFDIDVGAPGQAKHRTALAAPQNLELATWPAGSPWAPFDAEVIFSIWNHFGIYAFMQRMPPASIQDAVWYADNSLISVSSVTFAAEPISANLIGSIGGGQRPTGTAVLDNSSGVWNRRVNDEAWLGMGAGTFLLIRGLYTIPRLVGTVGSITLTEDNQVEIQYGMFQRDQPKAGEKIWYI